MRPTPEHDYLDEVMHHIKAQLDLHRKQRLSSKQLAIVFDIDQTAFLYSIRLCNRKTRKCVRKTFINPQRNEQIYLIYQYAIKHGITVFFVTARKEPAKQITLRQLKNLGFDQIGGLFLRPISEQYRGIQGIAKYKAAVRRWIVDKHNYDIILNMGDKWQDLHGGYSRRHYQVPETPEFLV